MLAVSIKGLCDSALASWGQVNFDLCLFLMNVLNLLVWIEWIFLSFVTVLLAPLLLPASCQTVNGSIGETLLWPCMHKLTKKFVREQTYIYWQGMDGSSNPTVAHVYVKGEEEFLYQSSSFQNRTAIFFSQLEDGNFSLLIKNLMLDHDRTFIEVVFISDDSKENICQKTLHVAGPHTSLFCKTKTD